MNQETGYAGATPAIQTLLDMLISNEPVRALEYAGVLEHLGTEDYLALAAHIRHLHARAAVEDVLWNARNPGTPD